jgi:putative ABC transport system permease protein
MRCARLTGQSSSSSFRIEGRPERIQRPLRFDIITPDFFRVLQVPLLRGRFFADRDRADTQRVAIINQTTAKTHWPNEELGKRFKIGDPDDDDPWLTVVGVVADTRRAGVDQPVSTESYQPHSQDPWSMTVLIRTAGDPTAIAPALRTAVRQLDPDQPLGAFGAAAIALTAIGLYSLLAYLVALRRHEMAVRLAIGGSPRHVLRLIVRHVSLVVGSGISLGLAGALTTARSMRGLLFGIQPWDPLSLAPTVAALGVVAVAAAWIPTRRAMRVDPAAVLRTE